MRKTYIIILISFLFLLVASPGLVLQYHGGAFLDVLHVYAEGDGGGDGGGGNDGPDEPSLVTILATKIVCESESDLPNWSGSSINISSSTASDFLEDHPDCHLEPDWQFQWGTSNATDPGGSFVGIAQSPWITFSSSTDSFGKTSVIIPVPSDNFVWVREVLKSGYLAFTGGPGNLPGSNVSAEMYCETDVLNYDDFDFIDNLEADQTYYCIAFNVLAETPPPPPPPPVCSLPTITSELSSTVTINQPFSYTITATTTGVGATPTTFSVATSSLPQGLSFSTITGIISGIPTETGTFNIVISATNGCGTDNKTLVITITSDGGGGGGGEGGGGGGGGGGGSSSAPPPTLPTDECFYLREYMRRDFNNDPLEVLKLQAFLINFEGHQNVSLTGVFDQATFEAVSAFQMKYFNDILEPWGHTGPTGYVYILTLKKINEIYCQRIYPLNQAQINEIVTFRALLESLRTQEVNVEAKEEVGTSTTTHPLIPIVGVAGPSQGQNSPNLA